MSIRCIQANPKHARAASAILANRCTQQQPFSKNGSDKGPEDALPGTQDLILFCNIIIQFRKAQTLIKGVSHKLDISNRESKPTFKNAIRGEVIRTHFISNNMSNNPGKLLCKTTIIKVKINYKSAVRHWNPNTTNQERYNEKRTQKYTASEVSKLRQPFILCKVSFKMNTQQPVWESKSKNKAKIRGREAQKESFYIYSNETRKSKRNTWIKFSKKIINIPSAARAITLCPTHT